MGTRSVMAVVLAGDNSGEQLALLQGEAEGPNMTTL